MLHSRRTVSKLLAGSGVLYSLANAGMVLAKDLPVMQVYKSPWCGCCGAWIEHVQSNGFPTQVIEMEDVSPIKAKYGVHPKLHSCHTAVIDGYVIEGHVPAQDIKRLIAEKPKATGLSVPGMPVGSPGMEQGDQRDPFIVVLFDNKGAGVFSRHNGA